MSSPAPPSYVPQDAPVPNEPIQGPAAAPSHATAPPPPAADPIVLCISRGFSEALEAGGTPDSAMSEMSLSDPIFDPHADAGNPFAHLDPGLLQAPFPADAAALTQPVH